MAFVDFPFFNNGAALSDFAILAGDFLLGAYTFTCFIKVHATGCNLYFWLLEPLSLTEYEVDVVVSFALVVMQSGHTFHTIPLAKLVRKFLRHLLGIILGVGFGKGDNQLSCFNALALCTAASSMVIPNLVSVI